MQPCTLELLGLLFQSAESTSISKDLNYGPLLVRNAKYPSSIIRPNQSIRKTFKVSCEHSLSPRRWSFTNTLTWLSGFVRIAESTTLYLTVVQIGFRWVSRENRQKAGFQKYGALKLKCSAIRTLKTSNLQKGINSNISDEEILRKFGRSLLCLKPKFRDQLQIHLRVHLSTEIKSEQFQAKLFLPSNPTLHRMNNINRCAA